MVEDDMEEQEWDDVKRGVNADWRDEVAAERDAGQIQQSVEATSQGPHSSAVRVRPGCDNRVYTGK